MAMLLIRILEQVLVAGHDSAAIVRLMLIIDQLAIFVVIKV